MCASPLRGAAVARTARQNTDLPLSAFCFRFSSSFPSSVAKRRACQCFHRHCLLPRGTEHRIKSVVTVQIAGVTWLGCKAASRDRESISLSPLGRGRLASSASNSGEGVRNSNFEHFPHRGEGADASRERSSMPVPATRYASASVATPFYERLWAGGEGSPRCREEGCQFALPPRSPIASAEAAGPS
jgi:hypothetical protein